MSESETPADTVLREPQNEELDNGAVRVVMDISDPVTDLGIKTDRVSVEASGSKVSEELAQHLWDELLIDVDDHDIGVFD